MLYLHYWAADADYTSTLSARRTFHDDARVTQ